MTGNIVARCIFGRVHFHNARDNLIENNIFIGGTLRQVEMTGWPNHKVFLEGTPDGCLIGMTKGYETYASLPAWRKYAGLQQGGHPKDAVPMANNRLLHNIFYYQGRDTQLYKHNLLPMKHFQSDYNLVYHFGLPLLAELRRLPAHGNGTSGRNSASTGTAWWPIHCSSMRPEDDYRLRPESPAFKLGFRAIPVEQIGPYADTQRASWPIVEAAGGGAEAAGL